MAAMPIRSSSVRGVGALLLALALGGCAGVDPRPDVAAVRSLVAERSAATRPQANATETALRARVSELLAHDLTPDAAVELAFLRNRRLEALWADMGIARAEWAEATRFPDPVLSGNVRFGVQSSGTGADLDLVEEFVRILQRPWQRSLSDAELEATKLATAAALFALAADVREAYFEAEAAEQMLELRERVAESAGLAADVARSQYQAGN